MYNKYEFFQERPTNIENVADFIQDSFPEQSLISLGNIVNLLTHSKDWQGWWGYHKENWMALGWENEHEIFTSDIPLLFTDSLDFTAQNYQFMVNAPRLNRNKIDKQGEFSWFPGLSVIAKIDESPLWAELYSALNTCPLITQYYKILPLQSWHFTAIDLFTPDILPQSREEWISILKTKFNYHLAEIKNNLENNPCSPIITALKNYTLGILMLQIDVDELFMSRIKKVANSIGAFETKTPHISFAYQYRSAPIMTLNAIERRWKEITDQFIGKAKIEMKVPKLCSFENMERFDEIEIDNQKSAVIVNSNSYNNFNEDKRNIMKM